MSLTALIAKRGSTVTVTRPTWTMNADGSQEVASYAEVSSAVRCLIGEVTDEIAQRVFGQVATVDARGWVAGEPDIATGDRLVVTAGPRLGDQYLVQAVRDEDYGSAHRHYDLGLQSTTETIA